jgi:2,3-dihydroxybiphenyl 1,2-dioxygenase
MKVKSLGYIGIESMKMNEWRTYCTDFMGLMEVSQKTDELRFRMDDIGWRISVNEGEKEDLSFAGFDARDRDTLLAICEQLANLGFEAQSDKDLARERNVASLYKVSDPDGMQVELYYGATEIAEQSFVSPAGVSGFVTGDQGLGHIVLYTQHEDSKYQFYTEGLGFRLSDTILMGGKLELTFLHCNPRHHTIALATAPIGKHINHFMVQANSLNDVGYANDRAQDLDIKVSSTLGCHTNDRMVSFYTQSPSGFDVEYGFGARTVDDNWSVAHHNSPSTWGHKRAVRN